MRICGMRTGISFEVTPADRRRLEALVRDRNTARKGVVARIGCQVLTQAFATTTDMLNAA